MPEPLLYKSPPSGGRPVEAVTLVLHGGKEWSREPTSARALSVLRMHFVTWHLQRRRRDHPLAVWMLRYKIRGWNGDEMSPLGDVRWALDQVRAEHGNVPIALVGHSMGGRSALRCAGGQARVVVGLAPWVPDGEPVAQLAGCQVLIAHGTRDLTTSPRRSRGFAGEAAGVAAMVRWIGVRRSGHGMIWRARAWHRLTSSFVLGALGFGPAVTLPDDARV